MITSTSNAKVKQLLQWQKKRKARDADGVFLIEGIRMYRETPTDRVKEVYASESFFKKHRQELVHWGTRMLVLSDTVFEHVSDTKTPQGILAVVEQSEYTLDSILSRKQPFLMVLDNLQDPGNLGTILRAGEAAGVSGVILSEDCVDIYNPKVIRSTMGSIYRVPFVYVPSLPEVLKECRKKGIQSYAAHLEGRHSYEEEDYTKGIAFLIGNEGNGLREEAAGAADCYIRIPMCGKVESLNAAVAAAVLMFEAGRQRRL